MIETPQGTQWCNVAKKPETYAKKGFKVVTLVTKIKYYWVKGNQYNATVISQKLVDATESREHSYPHSKFGKFAWIALKQDEEAKK